MDAIFGGGAHDIVAFGGGEQEGACRAKMAVEFADEVEGGAIGEVPADDQEIGVVLEAGGEAGLHAVSQGHNGGGVVCREGETEQVPEERVFFYDDDAGGLHGLVWIDAKDGGSGKLLKNRELGQAVLEDQRSALQESRTGF